MPLPAIVPLIIGAATSVASAAVTRPPVTSNSSVTYGSSGSQTSSGKTNADEFVKYAAIGIVSLIVLRKMKLL